MCSYLNLQIMLILNCFILDRNSVLSADNGSELSILDYPGLVVGVFIRKLDNYDFVAVGIAITNEAVVTACSPLAKRFRGQEIETYDTKLYSVVSRMVSEEQTRTVSSVHCFYEKEWNALSGKSSTGKGNIGLLKTETPFETKTAIHVTISTRIHWDLDESCALFYYKDEKDPTHAFSIQSFDVIPVRHRNSCSEFTLADTGVEPTSNQLCGFPLFPESPPCDVIEPGSPVFCSGSRLVGLVETSAFSTMAGRCFFLVNGFTADSIDHRLATIARGTNSYPQLWLIRALPVMTVSYRTFS